MKPFLETINKSPQQSLTVLDRRLDEGIPFEWHQHPEYELTLTLNSQGHRYIGDHVGPYQDNDLVLIGPNTPHTWHSDHALNTHQPHNAVVVWFSERWLEQLIDLCPEWASLLHLTEKARGALSFSRPVRTTLKTPLLRLKDLPPDQRLLAFIEVLQQLNADSEARPLCHYFLQSSPDDRLQPVIERLNHDYAHPPSTHEMAAMTHLSVSSFQRLFQRHTRQSPSQYIARLRIGHACAQLLSTQKPIAVIAQQVGYQSLTQFNKTFKTLKGQTPREFRTLFKSH